MRFDPAKVLLDPYGRGVVVPKNYSREAARVRRRQRRHGDEERCRGSQRRTIGKAIRRCTGQLSQTIIYEMHVRGFTRHPSSGLPEKTRGTYAGLIEKIPYLQQLGITAVELLPVFQFDAQDAPRGTGQLLGLCAVSFFAPHHAYSSRQDPLGPVNEFRDMVKALHRAGIEVILDVVFNHTAEGNHDGPTLELSRFGKQCLLHS